MKPIHVENAPEINTKNSDIAAFYYVDSMSALDYMN